MKRSYQVLDHTRGRLYEVQANNAGHAMSLARRAVGEVPHTRRRVFVTGLPNRGSERDGAYKGYTITQRGGPAKQAGRSEAPGARDGARPTFLSSLVCGAFLTKPAAPGVLLLAILLGGCRLGRPAQAQTRPTFAPPPRSAAPPRAVCSDGGDGLAAELQRARQVQSRLGDEMFTLARQRDKLNEVNAGLLNQLAREREQLAVLREKLSTPAEVPTNTNITKTPDPPAAETPPTRPPAADDSAAAPGLLAGLLAHLVKPWAIAALTAAGVSPGLAYGGWLLWRVLRRRKTPSEKTPYDAGELARLRQQVDDLLSLPQLNQPSKPSKQSEAPEAGGTFRMAYEEQAPIERDDREGRELLRLAQLEGRDPLQDAIAGRLMRNRLDAFADSKADPQKAEWANELRREIDQRYNEVAPTKFSITTLNEV